jgi:hypothetical protein
MSPDQKAALETGTAKIENFKAWVAANRPEGAFTAFFPCEPTTVSPDTLDQSVLTWGSERGLIYIHTSLEYRKDGITVQYAFK